MIKFSWQGLWPRLAPALLVGLTFVALPATGAVSRHTTHFRATFNDLQGDSPFAGSLFAEVGSFETSDPDVFSIGTGTQGNGFLVVADSYDHEESVLRCEFDPAISGAPKINASIQVTPDTTDGQLDIRASDDGSTPMIDVGWARGGDITINGSPVMTYEPGTTYVVTWNINDPFLGPTTLSTKIEGSNGSNAEVQTTLGPHAVQWGALDIVVPSSGSWGQFVIDEIRVVSGSSPLQLLGVSY